MVPAARPAQAAPAPASVPDVSQHHDPRDSHAGAHGARRRRPGHVRPDGDEAAARRRSGASTTIGSSPASPGPPPTRSRSSRDSKPSSNSTAATSNARPSSSRSDWRTDRALRRLEAMLIVADREAIFLLSGTGDLIQPDDGIVGDRVGRPVRAGGGAGARRGTPSSPRARSPSAPWRIAADICIYTNHQHRRSRSCRAVADSSARAHADSIDTLTPAPDRRSSSTSTSSGSTGQARRRHRAPQPHAAAEAAEGARRRRRAEEHPDDRPDRRRQDRDRAAPGEAGAVAVPESRGVEVHRGRLRRARRRVDGARPGGAGDRRWSATSATRSCVRKARAGRRGAAARPAAAAAPRGPRRTPTPPPAPRRRTRRRASACATSCARAGSITGRSRSRRAIERLPPSRSSPARTSRKSAST